LNHARHANLSAVRLATELSKIPGVEIPHAPQANAVFAKLEPSLWESLERDGWHFYDLFGTGEARLMCSWATTDQQIDTFISAIKSQQVSVDHAN
jgi:threonine aldolase